MADTERSDDRNEPTEAEVQAWIRRDNAEADKHAAEAEYFHQQALEKAQHVRTATIVAETAVIGLERERHKRAEELAADTFHYSYLFDKEVSEGSVKACISQLSKWERTATDPITVDLVINSPGGSIFDGFALIDFIETLHGRGHTVNTTAYGMAASMAGVLLQVGKTRRIGKNSLLLIHEGSLGAGGDFGKVEDRVKLMELLHSRILALFASRATPINPKVTETFIRRNWLRKDWWMTADETIKLGFADGFADSSK